MYGLDGPLCYMILEKHQPNVSIKKKGWTFHGHEFLGGKMVKNI
jgi:hypothetical protein